jgi:glycosyltransferase involved in cell wall biosynthesis
MLISVALPIYNGLPYLKEAVTSILMQDIDFEIVVSDDKSRDCSAEWVESLDDSRVRVLRNDSNVGIFGNLNRCLMASRGDFIQIFCQDDIMKPGYLADQVRLLRLNPSGGLVYGTPDYIDEDGLLIPCDLQDRTPEVIQREMYVWIASHYGSLPPSLSSVAVPRRTIEMIGLFNDRYSVAGDIEYYNRVAERSPILRGKQILHSIRSHQAMTSKAISTGSAYLTEELGLQDWYRNWWNADDFRKIQRFRAGLRGQYHLGWIRRTAQRGRFREAASALWRLNGLLPVHWALWWRLLAVFRPGARRVPTVPAPERV